MTDDVHLTQAARAQLGLVAGGAIRDWGADFATVYVGSLLSRTDFLAARPTAGTLRPDLAPDVRCFPDQGVTIYYRPRADRGIDVVAILSSLADHPLGDID